MSFRQAIVCIIVGPLCLFLQIALLATIPLFVAIGWLCGSKEPLREAWRIAIEPPLEMFKEVYRGEA